MESSKTSFRQKAEQLDDLAKSKASINSTSKSQPSKTSFRQKAEELDAQSKPSNLSNTSSTSFRQKAEQLDAIAKSKTSITSQSQTLDSAFDKKVKMVENELIKPQVPPKKSHQDEETKSSSQTMREYLKSKAHIEDEEASRTVDICFLVDATASMQPWIDLVKNKITELISEVKESYPKFDFRIACVVYRDFNTQEQKDAPEIHPFTTESSQIETFLNRIRTYGNTDTPENIYGGFEAALTELAWKSRIKALIHFADAPCHGKLFTDEVDNYPYPPQSQSKTLTWEVLWKESFENAKKIALNYHFLQISDLTQKMTGVFKELWGMGSKTTECTFEVHEADADARTFLRELVTSIKNSIKISQRF